MTQDRSRRGISARAVPIDTDAVAIERWVALAKLPQDLDMIVEADVARSFVPGILERFRSQGRPASVEDNDGETERRECGATMIAHTKAPGREIMRRNHDLRTAVTRRDDRQLGRASCRERVCQDV